MKVSTRFERKLVGSWSYFTIPRRNRDRQISPFWCKGLGEFAVMPVADAQAVSFGASAAAIKVYAEWELKDPVTKHILTLAQRTAAFEAWVSRMLVKTFHWEQDAADLWVAEVIHPNQLTCCSELMDALKDSPYSDHITKVQAAIDSKVCAYQNSSKGSRSNEAQKLKHWWNYLTEDDWAFLKSKN